MATSNLEVHLTALGVEKICDADKQFFRLKK